MNYIDIVVLISGLYGLIKGFSNGIITETSNLISVLLAIYIGVHFSELIYPYLNLNILSDYSNIIPLVAFLLVFIIILIIVKSIGELINRITNQLALGLISRFLGAVFGMTKLLVICVFFLFLATDHDMINQQTQEKSIFLKPLKKVSATIIPKLKKQKELIIKETKESTRKAKEELKQKINPE